MRGGPPCTTSPDKPECLRKTLAQDKYLFIIEASFKPLHGSPRRHPPIHCHQKAVASMSLPSLHQPVISAPLAWGMPGLQAEAVQGVQVCAGLACNKGAPPGPLDG